MALLNDPVSAKMALLAMYAEDMYEELGEDQKTADPKFDERVALQGLDFVQYIYGQDGLHIQRRLHLGDTLY